MSETRNLLKLIFNSLFAMMMIVLLLTGCQLRGENENAVDNSNGTNEQINRYEGEKSKAISLVYTTKRQLSLTFNGMADQDTMMHLLDELDTQQIKATFFLPGMRVAEEPEIAKEIRARGHEIENNTLNQLDMSKLSYEQMYSEIKLSNEVILRELGMKPRYVRTKSGTYSDDLRLATAHNGQEAIISSSLFLHNWQQETPQEKSNYIRKYINRGGILALDTEENTDLIETVQLIATAATNVGYKFVTLDQLIEQGGERKPLEEIEGYDAAQLNPPSEQDTPYMLVYKEQTNKKEIALTFDDWGTDYTVTGILDILQKYGIKASFFLRGDGVEKNPNLARAIAQAGHDVGNHTYSHPVITQLSTEQLQEEVVKAHQIITEAIQQKPTMYFRPPTGEINESTLKAVSATGYHTISIFDVKPSDYMRNKSADDIVQAILEQTQPGSVILLHLLDDTNTLEALPIAIEQLQSRGYSFVKLTDMFGQS